MDDQKELLDGAIVHKEEEAAIFIELIEDEEAKW
jgi:hypothetical protein